MSSIDRDALTDAGHQGPPAAVVHIRTVEEAAQRREELLSTLPYSADELRRRAQAYQLGANELATFEEVDALDWLIDHANR